MIDRNTARRSLKVAAALTVIVSPLWWFLTGGLPVLAIALQPWSLAILFNGMVPAWALPVTGLSPEFALAASVVVSLLAYTLFATMQLVSGPTDDATTALRVSRAGIYKLLKDARGRK